MAEVAFQSGMIIADILHVFAEKTQADYQRDLGIFKWRLHLFGFMLSAAKIFLAHSDNESAIMALANICLFVCVPDIHMF